MTLKKAEIAKPDLDPVRMTEIVLPSHTNALGTIFGGVVMGWMDIAAAISAQRYARSPVVTVSVDHLHFMVPIKIGYTVQLEAAVTYTGKTSMEIHVQVHAENSFTGSIEKATEAYFTFVAIDSKGRPTKVAPLIPKTDKQKRLFKLAELRREQRLQWRNATEETV